MGLIEIQYEEGQTPLDEEEKEGLLIPSVTTHGELNEVEQRNIEEAFRWTIERRRRFTGEEVLSEAFIKQLHRRMLGNVWKWAGDFRRTNKNIGVDKYQIGLALRQLFDDCALWMEHETFDKDEIAVRFKHRIVSIHCFPNGNGRHSRLMGDIIASKLLGCEYFTWGGQDPAAGLRVTYLGALRAADAGDYTKLKAFARS
jgi:Fic-DOC domain mobile mystery protein B